MIQLEERAEYSVYVYEALDIRLFPTKKEKFFDRFFSENTWLEILTSYCTNWRLFIVKISRDYLHLFSRKKNFWKGFEAFSLSHDNKSKNYPIALKFGTDVAFIYLQIEFVVQKNRSITKKVIWDEKFKTTIFESRFLREYLIDRLKLLTSYCTYWRLYVVKISRDYLHLFSRKNNFWKKLRFLCRTITSAKIIHSSWYLGQM